MIDTEFLDISGSEVPVKKTYEFGGITYLFEIKYNEKYDFFTIEIYDITGETLLFSNKLIYNQPIIDSKLAPFTDKIIPLNISVLLTGEGVIKISIGSLGNEIKLYTNVTSE